MWFSGAKWFVLGELVELVGKGAEEGGWVEIGKCRGIRGLWGNFVLLGSEIKSYAGVLGGVGENGGIFGLQSVVWVG